MFDFSQKNAHAIFIRTISLCAIVAILGSCSSDKNLAGKADTRKKPGSDPRTEQFSNGDANFLRCMTTTTAQTPNSQDFTLNIVNEQVPPTGLSAGYSETKLASFELPSGTPLTQSAGHSLTTTSLSNLSGTIIKIYEDDNSSVLSVNDVGVGCPTCGDPRKVASAFNPNINITNQIRFGTNSVSGKVYDAYGHTRSLVVTLRVSWTTTTVTETVIPINGSQSSTCPAGLTAAP